MAKLQYSKTSEIPAALARLSDEDLASVIEARLRGESAGLPDTFREEDPGDINSHMVVEEIKKNGMHAEFAQTFTSSAAQALALSGTDDIILTLGAGETNKVADILVHK